jgi:hypothetical protein
VSLKHVFDLSRLCYSWPASSLVPLSHYHVRIGVSVPADEVEADHLVSVHTSGDAQAHL